MYMQQKYCGQILNYKSMCFDFCIGSSIFVKIMIMLWELCLGY